MQFLQAREPCSAQEPVSSSLAGELLLQANCDWPLPAPPPLPKCVRGMATTRRRLGIEALGESAIHLNWPKSSGAFDSACLRGELLLGLSKRLQQ